MLPKEALFVWFKIFPIRTTVRCVTFDFGSGYSTGSGLLEKKFQKPDCVFHHSDIMILSCSHDLPFYFLIMFIFIFAI